MKTGGGGGWISTTTLPFLYQRFACSSPSVEQTLHHQWWTYNREIETNQMIVTEEGADLMA